MGEFFNELLKDINFPTRKTTRKFRGSPVELARQEYNKGKEDGKSIHSEETKEEGDSSLPTGETNPNSNDERKARQVGDG